jgi:hypothetical protein
VHDEWHWEIRQNLCNSYKSGPRYDFTLVNGISDLAFMKIYALFTIHLSFATHCVALVHRYQLAGRHRFSNYIELTSNGKAFKFIFTDTIIQMVHILSPWASPYNDHFTVQDISPDIFLRLLWWFWLTVSFYNYGMIYCQIMQPKYVGRLPRLHDNVLCLLFGSYHGLKNMMQWSFHIFRVHFHVS